MSRGLLLFSKVRFFFDQFRVFRRIFCEAYDRGFILDKLDIEYSVRHVTTGVGGDGEGGGGRQGQEQGRHEEWEGGKGEEPGVDILDKLDIEYPVRHVTTGAREHGVAGAGAG